MLSNRCDILLTEGKADAVLSTVLTTTEVCGVRTGTSETDSEVDTAVMTVWLMSELEATTVLASAVTCSVSRGQRR